jgi:hypothetical protein
MCNQVSGVSRLSHNVMQALELARTTYGKTMAVTDGAAALVGYESALAMASLAEAAIAAGLDPDTVKSGIEAGEARAAQARQYRESTPPPKRAPRSAQEAAEAPIVTRPPHRCARPCGFRRRNATGRRQPERLSAISYQRGCSRSFKDSHQYRRSATLRASVRAVLPLGRGCPQSTPVLRSSRNTNQRCGAAELEEQEQALAAAMVRG